MWPGGPIMVMVIITMMVVVVMMAIMMREVHKCGQVCLVIEVGQVASNWETPSGFKLGDPKGFIQSDLLDQNLERNNKTHCFAFSNSFLN